MERRDSGVKIFFRNFYSTGLPNLTGIILASPLERYSIICQTRSILKSPLGYPNFLTYITQVPDREGILGLFRGSMVRSLHYLVGSAITFRTYYYLNSKISSIIEAKSPLDIEILKILSSSTIFLATEFFVYNYERARTLIACDFKPKGIPRTYNGSFDVLSYSLRVEGIKNVYAGFPLYIGSYAFFLSIALIFSKKFEELGVGNNKMTDFAAFGVAKAVVYPLDLIRRRNQVSGTEYFQKDRRFFYWQIKDIVNNEGIKGLYRGFLPAMLHTFTCLNLVWILSGDSYFKAD